MSQAKDSDCFWAVVPRRRDATGARTKRKRTGEFQYKGVHSWKGSPNWPRGFLDQVPDAVIYANHSGTIIRWNHASTALFGYSAEEALGQSIELIIVLCDC